uniref:Immunoglobulin V-set domain-containing protein n=1 Tax=Astyanax mexicanus TaxID=7994 RepID=A0A8B9GSJ2_ASTMX
MGRCGLKEGTWSNIVCPDGLKFIQKGEDIIDASATAWFKQTPGESPLLVASAYHIVQVSYHNGFDKSGRFNAVREKNSFNLKISNAEPSDSATYYCVIAYYTDVALFHYCFSYTKLYLQTPQEQPQPL